MPAEAKRKRSEGLRQRLAQAEADERGKTVGDQSHLAQFLLQLYAWVEMSPQMVQRVSKLVLEDIQASAENPRVLNDLEVLAGIGTGGTHKNKCHADLMAKVERMSKLPSPFRVTIPFKQPLGEAPQGILLPHEMFSSLSHNYQETWKSRRQSMHPQMRQHPIKDKANYKTTTVPTAIHSGPRQRLVQSDDSFQLVIIGGAGFNPRVVVLGVGYVRQTMHRWCCRWDPGKIFAVLKWSLMTMMEGVWPTHDFEGNEHLALQCECLF